MANLTTDQRKYLNSVFATAYRKYNSVSSESLDFGAVASSTLLTDAECESLAEIKYAEYQSLREEQINASADQKVLQKQTKIEKTNSNYEANALAINSAGQKRGLSGSSVIISALANALAFKNSETAKIQSEIDFIELKRMNDLAKLNENVSGKVQAFAKKLKKESVESYIKFGKEVSLQTSRSLKDLISMGKADISINKDEAMNKEIYAKYLEFLLVNFSPDDAVDLVQNDEIFYSNLSSTYYDMLLEAVEVRA
ncbi:MAG: hypothetical protein LBM01_00970 [Christensenellaceae bacterium]|jgi:hypothetical protein|nr:hypothetical protein [Christensenellaceae bacterium]